MASVDLTQSTFNETIDKNDIVLVDFWASWCGPCKNFAPIYEEASEKYPDYIFGKVNTEEEQELAGTFQVRSIPTLIIFREKIIIFSQPGMLQGSQLDEILGKVNDLDMDKVRADLEEQQEA